MNHIIELVNLEDTKELLNIYAPYIKNTAITFEYDIPPINEFKTRISNTIRYYPWIVYKENNKIVGYAYASRYKERAAFQWDTEVSVYISPSHQGKGIAKALYQTLFDLLLLQGFYNAYALIRVPNEKSINLHLKFGFSIIGTAKNTGYKFNEWHDLASLVKPLKSFEIKPVPTIPYSDLNKDVLNKILSKYIIN